MTMMLLFKILFLLPCGSAFVVPAQSTTTTTIRRTSSSVQAFVEGPSRDTRPDYENIHGPMGKTVDNLILKVFRGKMAEHFGFDSDLPYDDYQGLMDLTAAMNARYSDRTEVQGLAQDVLRAMFPSWMPPSYAVLFSKPFPGFSSQMNAWATMVGGTWLMGECEINDVEKNDAGEVGVNQGLLVKRCRFLEESGCASVCVNSCKIPTQSFFLEDMGLPLTMTPDYETYECQFSFGLTPSPEEELDAKNTPCLSRCPTSGGMRKWHTAGEENDLLEKSSQCSLMESGDDDRLLMVDPLVKTEQPDAATTVEQETSASRV